MPQAAQTDRAAPGDRPFSGREANHSSAERQTVQRPGGGSAAVSQKFNFDEFFMAFSMLFHYNENDG